MKGIPVKSLFLILSLVVCSVACASANTVTPVSATNTTTVEEVAKGIAAAAKEMSLTPEEFSKTSYGKLLWWILFWNYCGFALWKICGATALLIVGNTLLYRVHHKYFGQRKTGDRKDESDYSFEDVESRWLNVLFLYVAWVLINVVGVVTLLNPV